MNITIVDISNAKRAKEGDEVLLISNNSEDRNSVVNIAKLCQTNPHDILVHIPEHLHRDLAK